MTSVNVIVVLTLLVVLAGAAPPAGAESGGPAVANRFLALRSRGDEIFTMSTTYANVPGMTASIEVGGTGPSCVVVTLSTQAAAVPNDAVVIRVVLDGVPMLGHEADADIGLGIHSAGSIDTKIPAAHTFWRCDVTPGTHAIAVRWKSDNGGQVSLHARTLVIQGR